MLIKAAGLALTWIGVAGGATTLFAKLLAPLDMVDWTWWMVEAWQEATATAWQLFGTFMGLEVPAALLPALTLSLCILSVAFGIGIAENARGRRQFITRPSLRMAQTTLCLLIVGYLLLADHTTIGTPEPAPKYSSLTIFLAAAAFSFFPLSARSADLTKYLWCVLAGTGLLITSNYLTKITLQVLGL